MNLFELLSELDEIERIVMSSIFMLHSDQVLRGNVYRRVLAKGGEIHFVLENIVLSTPKDIDD